MLNNLINRILQPFGARLTRLDTYKKLMFLQERQLSAKKELPFLFLEAAIARHSPFRFIQIGANDGVSFDSLYRYVTTTNCKGIVIEPIGIYFQELVKNYRNHPEIIPVNVAVHKSLKKANMYFVDPTTLDEQPDWASGIGSLDPDHHRNAGIVCDRLITEVVQCVHLMDLIKTYELETVNYIQIDTEGYDSEIIAMIDFDVINPTLIRFEHIHLSDEQKRKCDEILTSQGFQLLLANGDTIAWNTSAT